jgi:hypothetical protein
MADKENTEETALGEGRHRLVLPGWMKKLTRKKWFRVSPMFFGGTIITSMGTTTIQNDTMIFAGMLIMGVGIVAMWIAETGKPNLLSFTGPLVFLAGSLLSAMSMTIYPSNALLCGGMILTGAGTLGMWVLSLEKRELSVIFVAVLFMAGIALEAVSLTLIDSNLMIMIGMIATGIGAFTMWAYETNYEGEEE